jgi:hypothetical protein
VAVSLVTRPSMRMTDYLYPRSKSSIEGLAYSEDFTGVVVYVCKFPQMSDSENTDGGRVARASYHSSIPHYHHQNMVIHKINSFLLAFWKLPRIRKVPSSRLCESGFDDWVKL